MAFRPAPVSLSLIKAPRDNADRGSLCNAGAKVVAVVFLHNDDVKESLVHSLGQLSVQCLSTLAISLRSSSTPLSSIVDWRIFTRPLIQPISLTSLNGTKETTKNRSLFSRRPTG